MFSLIKSIFDGIPSTIENDRIQTSINDQKDRLNKGLVKGIQIEDSALRSAEFYKRLDSKLKREVKSYRGNPIDYMFMVAEKRIKNNDRLLAVAERIFSGKTPKRAMDYERVNVITYISLGDWFFDYAVAALSVMTCEITYADHSNPYKEGIDKEYQSFVYNDGNMKTFAVICEALAGDFDAIMENAAKLEGITFDPESIERIRSQYSSNTVDPMRVGFLPVIINPFYWLGQAYNNWTKYRHEQAKADINALKVKLLRLEAMRRGAAEDSDEIRDIDKQIEYYNDHLAKLKEIVEDIENDV